MVHSIAFMNCHLVIPGLKPRDEAKAEFLAGVEAPALQLLLARGETCETGSESYEAWLCRRFGIHQQSDWPIAPLLLNADGGRAGNGYWLCADPVCLQPDAQRLLLADRGVLGIDASEAEALVGALNAHFAEQGYEFVAPRPDRWYLRLDRPHDVVCTPPHLAAGRDVDPLLPRGADSRRLHALLNEIQMLLYAHPVSERREAEGRAAINSVWLWGGGVQSEPPRGAITELAAADDIARAVAAASGVPVANWPVDAGSLPAGASGDYWIVLDSLRAAEHYGDCGGWQTALREMELAWFAPLVARLRAGTLGRLTVTAHAPDSYFSTEVSRASLRRFWRRARPLSVLLANA